MTEPTEAEIIALERRNYRRRFALILITVFLVAVGAVALFANTEGFSASPHPRRLSLVQAVAIGTIGYVLIFGTAFAIMRRFRPPRSAVTARMRLLRADDLQRRAVRGLLWLSGFLVIGMLNAIRYHYWEPRPEWFSALMFCGGLFFVVQGLVTGIGLDASNLAKPLNDELTRAHRRRALASSCPAIIAAFAAAYLACFGDPSRVFWVFPLALTFSALLPVGLFAFWELRAAHGD
jgi:hypothetical protein